MPPDYIDYEGETQITPGMSDKAGQARSPCWGRGGDVVEQFRCVLTVTRANEAGVPAHQWVSENAYRNNVYFACEAAEAVIKFVQ